MKRIVVLILTLVFCNQLQAQKFPNDCINALTVCGNGTFISNATGPGNVKNENTACSGGEFNSLWMKINIVQAGTLGFNLIPNDPSILVDYDFYVYGPNTPCAAKGSAIRCCTTNPNLAGLSSNITGMNDKTLMTTSGPGANGNGYVRWLDVKVGETYFIAIDRPVGDGGFSLEWIGSATDGTGAFPSPPVANAIPDYVTCSSTPNIGIFFFDDVFKATINPDIYSNIISVFKSQQDATDNLNPVKEIYSNISNPQKVYTRVTDILTGCYSISEFNLVVSELPTVNINVSSNNICLGESVDVIFTGTPTATIEYSINNGAKLTAVLDVTGNFILKDSPTINTDYKLLSASVIDASGVTSCKEVFNITKTVNVLPLPTASISGTTTICESTTTEITFSGTPDATVNYTVDGVATTIVLDATGHAIINTPASLTTKSIYQLVSVTSAGATPCTQPLSESTIITVNPLPTATISGTTTVCQNDTNPLITFTGTNGIEPYTFTYTINSGTPQTITTTSGNSVTVSVPTTATGAFIYDLITVEYSGVNSCINLQAGNATVSVISLPTATISGTTTICEGTTAPITFSGTPNATVTYTVDGVTATVVLDASGNAIITTPNLTTNSIYELVSVISSSVTPCTQLQSGSAIITVNPSPTATISGTTTVCQNSDNPLITFTGANGLPPYVFSYTLNSGAIQTITTTSGNSVTISVPTTTIGPISYDLVSVAYSGSTSCTQIQTGNATVTVISLPTVMISGTTTICSDTTAQITFTGTPNATVAYSADGTNAIVVLDPSGNAIITTPKLLNNSTYDLIGVTLAGNAACSQPQIGSVLITVKPYATVIATPSPESICSGANTNIILSSSDLSTTYAWTANPTGVNGASDGIGNTIIQNLTTKTANSGNVIYTVLPITNGCVELPVMVTVNVSPKPTATATANQNPICSGEKTNISLTSDIVGTTFSWTVLQSNVSGALAGSGDKIEQILTTNNLNPGSVTYTITPDNNGCIGLPITIVINVNPLPVASYTSAVSICNGDATNIILSSNLAGTTFSWTASATGVSGASSGSGKGIDQVLTLTSDANGKVVYTVTPLVNGCNGKTIDITINVEQLPNPNIEDGTICVDQSGTPIQTYTLDTGLDNLTHKFEWYFNGSLISGAINNTYVATKIGVYGVIATNIKLGCKSVLNTATINESIPGKSLALSQTAYFSDNASIYATVDGGNGTYTYQLDNGSFQVSNVFSNVQPGLHKVTVNDTNGCTDLSAEIFIVGYPKFFTPNGDGYNDTWNIIASGNLTYKKITIFDRYGKFLIQLNPHSNGWDGSYNGKNLPSTDYWFVFDYSLDGLDQTFKSHFSLKR